MRRADPETPGQPLDAINAIGTDGWASLSLSFGGVAGSVPRLSTLSAQCAQSVAEKRYFRIAQTISEGRLFRHT